MMATVTPQTNILKTLDRSLPAGIVASCVTPFSADGQINYSQLKPHVDWLIGEGAAGLSPLGSSGEFTVLEVDDRKRLLEEMIKINDGRAALWAGTHHYSTRTTVELSRHAAEAGADALLIVPPYYMAPTPEQVMDHYRRIADAVDIPIVLYHNIPLTCVDLKTDHLLTLFNEGAIAAVKMSNPDPDRICELLQEETSGVLRVYCGLDSVAFEGLCHGAHGWISGIPSIVPRAARQLYEAIAVRGDLISAREQWRTLSKLMRLEFSAYTQRGNGPHWFSVMKAAFNLIGPPVGDPEPPVQPLGAKHRAELIELLSALGYQVQGES
ncbi:MAG: dihydrodipicolinate synthase family protein [Acidobacteriales bacterium]|nr:dihydrodipicolinate synthase family protein [Terriglobales bacterium]